MLKESFIIIFVGIGIATTLGVIVCLINWLIDWLKETYRERRWNYKYKHRFDKPPTAQCYCKDCHYHLGKTNRCDLWSEINCYDDSFCYRADPMTYTEQERKAKSGY